MKKKNRIRKSDEFQLLIKKGEKYVSSAFVLYVRDKQETEARAGVSLSRKIGNAVHRNLYKRQLRMMLQELIDFKNCSCDFVVIVRFAYLSNSYAVNKNSLEKLLIKARIK